MTEVLQKSDFALKVSFIDLLGRGISLKKFKFSYSTQLSTPIVASFDGQNYSPNCIAQSDGVLILFGNPLLNTGQLKVHRQYSIDSSTFPDGQRNVDQIEMLPIEIVYTYSRTKQTPTPINIMPSQENMIITEVVVVEAIQGQKGDNGIDGVDAMVPDYSLLTEQKLEGRFWGNDAGQKVQMYSKTIIGTFPSVKTGSIGIAGRVISVDGCIYCYSAAYKEAMYVNGSTAIFRDAGAYGVYYDIPDNLQGKKYQLNFTYCR